MGAILLEDGSGLSRSWTIADFFSCGGGTSAGFVSRQEFGLVAAVDLELAKPSGGVGASDCNATFFANHRVQPLGLNMMTLEPAEFTRLTGIMPGELTVMISCAPCTHLSRANPKNHLVDKVENTLIGRSGEFVRWLRPEIFFMENTRELITGNYNHHHDALVLSLEAAGYEVRSEVHFLDRFGLPQVRERALVIASRIGRPRTLSDLWEGREVDPCATTVRTALERLGEWKRKAAPDTFGDVHPGMTSAVRARLEATPPDGGGWIDVARSTDTRHLLTKDCLRRWSEGNLGSHPDVYGRMKWDKPAPTIKRECSHIGNGRYAHPTENRLLTVREMATLQGFPFDYQFPAKALTNRYRHVGDAVPPLIAYQMSALAKWMKTGIRPHPNDWVMPNTTLRVEDIRSKQAQAA